MSLLLLRISKFQFLFRPLERAKILRAKRGIWWPNPLNLLQLFFKNTCYTFLMPNTSLASKFMPLAHELFITYFSPHSAHAIEMNGVLYPTLEHAYQCSRYSDETIQEEIRLARSPLQAWEISQKYKSLQMEEFTQPEHKLKVMKSLMRLKVEQHIDVEKALIDSGDVVIVKHIFTYPKGDGFWDDGENGEGLNRVGRMWMELREELKS